MKIPTAIDLVTALTYKPGWSITATDHTNRYEGTIVVRIDYPARNSDRDQAPAYPQEISTYASFPVIVEDCGGPDVLYRRILEAIVKIEEHEAREFLRVSPTRWAPFHPHTIDGMRRWGTPDMDIQFGIV